MCIDKWKYNDGNVMAKSKGRGKKEKVDKMNENEYTSNDHCKNNLEYEYTFSYRNAHK